MSDRVALIIGLILLGAIVVDAIVFDWQVQIFIGRKLMTLIEHIAFWR
jgi:hypothetical protein